MKHVIVIETPDDVEISNRLRAAVEYAVDDIFEKYGIVCFVQARFAESSAIAAVHEMYNAPKWDPDCLVIGG